MELLTARSRPNLASRSWASSPPYSLSSLFIWRVSLSYSDPGASGAAGVVGAAPAVACANTTAAVTAATTEQTRRRTVVLGVCTRSPLLDRIRPRVDRSVPLCARSHRATERNPIPGHAQATLDTEQR